MEKNSKHANFGPRLSTWFFPLISRIDGRNNSARIIIYWIIIIIYLLDYSYQEDIVR